MTAAGLPSGSPEGAAYQALLSEPRASLETEPPDKGAGPPIRQNRLPSFSVPQRSPHRSDEEPVRRQVPNNSCSIAVTPIPTAVYRLAQVLDVKPHWTSHHTALSHIRGHGPVSCYHSVGSDQFPSASQPPPCPTFRTTERIRRRRASSTTRMHPSIQRRRWQLGRGVQRTAAVAEASWRQCRGADPAGTAAGAQLRCQLLHNAHKSGLCRPPGHGIAGSSGAGEQRCGYGCPPGDGGAVRRAGHAGVTGALAKAAAPGSGDAACGRCSMLCAVERYRRLE